MTEQLTPITATNWSPRLGAVGEIVSGVEDLAQQIRLVLSTPTGSVPLDPDFGCRIHDYLDWPIAQARPQVLRAIVEALTTQVPGIVLVRVTADSARTDEGMQLAVMIEWLPAEGGATRATQVALGTSALVVTEAA